MENDARLLNILVVNAEKRLPRHPGVPTMLELTDNPAHRAMLEFMMLQGLTGRAIFTPPDVPAERVAALRAAFEATMRDPAFNDDMKRLKVEIEASTGEEVAHGVRRVLGASPETAEMIRKVVE